MNKALVLTFLITGLAIPGVVRAQVMPAVTESQTADAATKPVEVGNKFCPVSKEEVGKEGMAPFKVTYKGKVYNLCCSMCEKDFLKDPEKYSKIMDEEAASQKDKQAVPEGTKS